MGEAPVLTEGDERVLTEGDELGRFRVVRPIGAGGFGEVYLARDLRLGRWVALKLLRRAARVLQEARAAARLNHPNIVTVYDVGEDDAGRAYLALEYVPGDTLRDRLNRERLPEAEALRLGKDLAEAVAAAHAEGVLHLDLSARNVMLGADGRLRVVDFGLARTGDDGDDAPAGTPPYMAPEQWLGGALGPPADVWALGILLHEMIAGAHPFATAGAQLRERVCAGPPITIDAPPSLASIAAACLERDPARRPSASEVAARLAAIEPSDPTATPFRGLAPFEDTTGAAFWGRDAELATLVELLHDTPSVCVVGPSGAGKSSLLRAGLAARLRARGWTVVVVRPGPSPLEALGEALAACGAGAGDVETLRTGDAVDAAPRVTERWRRSANLLGLDLADAAAAAGTRLAILIDPLEEVETLVEPSERDLVLDALARAADDPRGPVRVVFALRDDFLGRLAARLAPGASLGRIHVLTTPLRSALRAIVERPVAAAGYRFDDGLVDEMLRAVRGEAAALSLLQVTCAALWERRDDGERRLTRAAYDEMGGVAGALADHGERALAACTPDELDTARTILLRMIGPDGTRRPRNRTALLAGVAGDGGAMLDRLIAARLVTARRGRTRTEELELAHDLLIQGWPALRLWLLESRGEHAALEELEAAARRWRERWHRRDELWRGDALSEARRRLERTSAPVAPVTRAFVAAATSRERRRRWQTRLTAAVAAAAIVAIALILAAQRREARRQEALARRREGLAMVEAGWSALAERRMVEARALLRAAVEIEVSAEARALAWRLAVEPIRLALTLPVPSERVAWSHDGASLAVVGADSLVRAIDVRTGQLRALGAHRDLVLALAASPAAPEIATGSNDGELRVWPLAGGAPRRIATHAAPIQALAYSADGRRVVAADAVGTVVVRDAIDGAERARVALGTGIYDVALAGDRIAVLAANGAVILIDPDGRRVTVPAAPIASLVASARGGIVLGAADGHVLRWRGEAAPADLGAVQSRATVHAAGARIAAGGLDGEVRIWRGGRATTALELGAAVRAVALDPGGEQVAAIAGTRLVVASLATPRLAASVGFSGSVNEVAFTSDGRRVVAGGDDGVLRSFDLATGRALAHRRTDHGRIRGMATHGPWVYTAGADGTVRRWRADDLTGGARIGRHDAAAVDLAVTSGLVASAAIDGTIGLWPETGPSRLLRAGAPVYGVAIAPVAGRVVALTDDRRVLSWPLDGDGPAELVLEDTASITDLVALADGRRVVVLGASPHPVIDLVDGSRTYFATPQRLFSGAGGPDPSRLVVAGDAGYGAVIDLARGTTVELGPHHLDFLTARFGPRGERVATAGEDGLVGMWRAADGGFAWGDRATAAPIAGADPGAPRSITTAALDVGPLRLTGHADGLVTIAAASRTAATLRRHGAVTTLARDGDRVVVRTVVGRAEIPLPLLQLPACELVRAVWADVPSIWRGGALVVAPPDPAHACR